MEAQSDGNDENALPTIKGMRQRLEARIQSRHGAQLELLSALQAHVEPNIVSAIDLSLKIVSSFDNRSFIPTPPLPDPKPNPKKTLESTRSLTPETRSNRSGSAEPRPNSNNDDNPKTQNPKTPTGPNSNLNPARNSDFGEDKFSPMDESGSPLLVVRSMVAVCLLERVPFSPIDSSTVLRKLENDQSATPAEKAALRELGGETGAILAVEMALRSMAEENGGVELEEFVVSGKSRVMVLAIDRTRLVKELPESGQYQPPESNSGDGNQNQQQGVDVNGGVFGMAGPVRPMPDMWMGPNDPHMSGLPPIFPGSGPPGAMMGPRGGPRVLGMMGLPRIGVPPFHRPPLGPNAGGSNAMPQKPRSEDDDLKDLEALLNKKSYREMQKSKTGEELLDLIHRPTARETAVAAKVCTLWPFCCNCYFFELFELLTHLDWIHLFDICLCHVNKSR